MACAAHINIVRLLLKWGVSADAPDDVRPVTFSVKSIVLFNVDCHPIQAGCTAFMLAAECGNVEILQTLLDHGANAKAVNKVMTLVFSCESKFDA